MCMLFYREKEGEIVTNRERERENQTRYSYLELSIKARARIKFLLYPSVLYG